MKTIGAFFAVLWLCGAVSSEAVNYYVDRDNAVPVYPFTNGWTAAATNIQDAVNASVAKDTVWVAEGRYTLPTNYVVLGGTNTVFINKAISLLASGARANTIIDGRGKYRGIMVYNLVSTADRFVIDGFTITNCLAIATNNENNVTHPITGNGAGILFQGQYGINRTWYGIVRNCEMSHNLAKGGVIGASTNAPAGAGFYASWSAGAFGLAMTNCVFHGNLATNINVPTSGIAGAMYLRATGPKTITDCLFERNKAVRGGALYTAGGSVTLERCIIRNNYAGPYLNAGSGAGGYYPGGATIMLNCLVYENYCGGSGGGIGKQGGGYLDMVNCTVVSNWATLYGGGIYTRFNAGVRMVNSVVYSNRANANVTYQKNIHLADDGTYPSYFTNSCFTHTAFGTLNGSGNIQDNPLFADFAGGNYRLKFGSPCMNTGTNQTWMSTAIDLDGNPRVDSRIVDMGCYEFVTRGTAITIQ